MNILQGLFKNFAQITWKTLTPAGNAVIIADISEKITKIINLFYGI